MTCYQNMTAKELHNLVTRLEAHGFKLPEGLEYSETFDGVCWVLDGNYIADHFAAAIIEVAARDKFIGAGMQLTSAKNGWKVVDFTECVTSEGPTPLHAIVAAVEAKEGK